MANRDNCFMLDVVDDAESPALHVATPGSVLVISSVEQLQERLVAFSDPVKNKVVQNTTKARRWYVEKVLPALRYYCGRFGVEQPGWLATNGHWERMTDEEKQRLFGPEPLKLREFAPIQCPDIAVVRDSGGDDQEQTGG
jgi:hypothetical protein